MKGSKEILCLRELEAGDKVRNMPLFERGVQILLKFLFFHTLVIIMIANISEALSSKYFVLQVYCNFIEAS